MLQGRSQYLHFEFRRRHLALSGNTLVVGADEEDSDGVVQSELAQKAQSSSSSFSGQS